MRKCRLQEYTLWYSRNQQWSTTRVHTGATPIHNCRDRYYWCSEAVDTPLCR